MVWDDSLQCRRRLTVAECAIIQGFPSDHPWQGNKTSQYRQVGNAVPPKLAEVVARAVIAADQLWFEGQHEADEEAADEEADRMDDWADIEEVSG